MNAIRVMLVDDHVLVRSGIRALLENMEGIEVVAEASDGREALDQVARDAPSLILMDIVMSGLNGLEVTARLTRLYPYIRVLVLSMYTNEEYVWRALQSGAAGYVAKGADITELEMAIRIVAAGGTYLSAAVPHHILRDYIRNANQDLGTLNRLTPRQREILQLVAEGHTTQYIAQRLCLSIKTVETHRSHMMSRLGIHDIAGLVRYAIRAGVIGPDA
ncbi:MAG TPA: response regulator transcription factor [Chthonomonadaceae bacterium]|nr:response regulator transcription factor [Chthonomonadaceae bacterium]